MATTLAFWITNWDEMDRETRGMAQAGLDSGLAEAGGIPVGSAKMVGEEVTVYLVHVTGEDTTVEELKAVFERHGFDLKEEGYVEEAHFGRVVPASGPGCGGAGGA